MRMFRLGIMVSVCLILGCHERFVSFGVADLPGSDAAFMSRDTHTATVAESGGKVYFQIVPKKRRSVVCEPQPAVFAFYKFAGVVDRDQKECQLWGQTSRDVARLDVGEWLWHESDGWIELMIFASDEHNHYWLNAVAPLSSNAESLQDCLKILAGKSPASQTE